MAVSCATDWSVLKAESDYLHRSGIVSLQSSFITSSSSPSLPTIAFRSAPSPTLQVQHFGVQSVRLSVFSWTLQTQLAAAATTEMSQLRCRKTIRNWILSKAFSVGHKTELRPSDFRKFVYQEFRQTDRHNLQRPVVAFWTVSFSAKNCTFCPHSVPYDTHRKHLLFTNTTNKPPSLSLTNDTCVSIPFVTCTHTLYQSLLFTNWCTRELL